MQPRDPSQKVARGPEAIEAPYRRFVLGVQWHPEADERSRVVGALVEHAREYRSARALAAL